MQKIITYAIFIILYALVTVFGLGPVLLADGTTAERVYTLIVVVILYTVLTIGLVQMVKRFKKMKL